MTGVLQSICLSGEKGVAKTPVSAARLVANHGLDGDAHAGPWHRQVSLLNAADVAAMKELLPDLAPGSFAENLTIHGVDLAALGLGSVLRLGDSARLRVSQLGKTCHARCAIYEQTGDCIMPRLGVFARVLDGGWIRPGDPVSVETLISRDRFQVTVLTLSDRAAGGETEDTAGPAVARLLEEQLNAHLYRREILPDDADQLARRLKHYCDGHSLDLVLTVGGTGFGPRDVTPEATRPLLDRLAPGLDEAMRSASRSLTPLAALSRGVSGIRGATLVINLPGSESAAVENLRSLLPMLPHALNKLRGDATDCGRPSPWNATDHGSDDDESR